MTTTKPNWLKRSLSLLLALVMCMSMISVTVFAAEDTGAEDSAELEPGTYTTFLRRFEDYTGEKELTNSALHFSGQVILKITEDGRQFITIGVENWSLYDTFIPRKQDYLSGYSYSEFPAAVFNAVNYEYFNGFESWASKNSEKITEEANQWYNYSTDVAKKFGDIEIVSINPSTNIAYVTFEIDDYTKMFAIRSWLNTYASTNKGTLWYDIYLGLDSELICVDQLISDTDDVELSYVITLATQRSNATTKGKYASRMGVSFSGESTAKSVFDSAEVKKSGDGKFNVKYHVNTSVDGIIYSNFRLLKSVSYDGISESKEWDKWDYLLTSEFEELQIEDGYISVDYNSVEEALTGKLIFFDTNTTSDYVFFCSPCLTTAKNEELIIKDEATGIYVVTNTTIYPKTTKLRVDINQTVLYYNETTGENEEIDKKWSSSLFENPEWYSIYLTDESGNVLKKGRSVDLYVPLPEGYSGDDYYVDIRKDGALIDSSDQFKKQNPTSRISNGYLERKNQSVDGITVAFMKLTQRSDVNAIADDGIYTANAYFLHSGRNGDLSMADAGFETRKVYIVVENGVKKMYFKTGVVTLGAYIGDVFCDNLAVQAGENAVYEDSISYTDFEVQNGEIVANCDYNAYTEFANVKGGILTLMDECYIADEGVYAIALVSPIMCSLSGTPIPYDEIRKDDTVAWLVFQNLEKCGDDVTLDTVKAEYGYKPSSLLRKIRLAEIYIADEDSYTSESIAALKSAHELAQTVYEATYADAVAASDAYEEQITLVQAAIDALELDESAIGDKTELQALVEKAKTYSEDKYTNSSYRALQTAIEVSEKLLAKDAVKQSKLDEQVAALQAAIDALEEKPATTLDKDNLPDGKYKLTAEMIKTDRKNYSMSNDAINHTVWLEVINGEYYLTMQFKGLAIYNQFGYLANLSYYDAGYTYGDYGTIDGTLIPAEVLSVQKDSDGNVIVDQYNDKDNPYPELIRFKLVDKASETYVPLHVFVPIMDAIASGTGDQDVLMQLDWSTLQVNEGEIETEKPEEQSPAVDYTDEATGVKVHADKGVLPEGVQVVVTEITQGATYDNAASALSDVGKKFRLYDVKFLDADGNEVTPNGTITVYYPIASGYDADNLAVYRINEDGTKTLVRGEVEDGYYKFVTRTAANTALVEKDSTVTDDQTGGNTENPGNTGNNGTTNSPQTGDNSNLAVWFLLMLASGAALVTMTFCRRRETFLGE